MRASSKDFEFSRRSMEDHWTAGFTTRSAPSAIRKSWNGPTSADGVFTFDLAAHARF